MAVNKDNLSEKLRANSDEAYVYVYEHYFPLMCKHANIVLKDQDKAQDISQQTILNLWEKRNQIDEVKNVFNYLMKSVHNNCLNKIRDEGRRDKRMESAIDSIEKVHLPDYTAEMELLSRINDILDKEDEGRRTIFELNRFEGLTAKEISQKLDLPIGKVKYDIHMVMKNMTHYLKDYLPFLIIILINMLDFAARCGVLV